MPAYDAMRGISGKICWGFGVFVFLLVLWGPCDGRGEDASLEEAKRLNSKAMVLYQAGRYKEAIPLVQRALFIFEKVLGLGHPYTAANLNNLAELYRATGAYTQAESLYQKALEINEAALGHEHPETAMSLANLGGLYQSTGAYTQAKPLLQRALAIHEKALGPESPETALSLNNLALLYHTMGDYAEAEPLYLRAQTIYEMTLGAEHPETARSLINLGGLYNTIGDYTQAEPLYQRALAIFEMSLGFEHPDTAASLNVLAELYRIKGAYAQSEQLHQRALAIREKVLGPKHPDTAMSLNNIALLYYTAGAYTKAEPLLKRAILIYENVLGPEHPEMATLINNLAELYRTTGAYAQAEPLLQNALSIFDKVFGPEHSATALSLTNLALLYHNMGDYDEAEPLLKRALEIYEKALGSEHPDTSACINSLALLYQETGDYDQAELLYKRSLAIREKVLGHEHPDTAISLHNLAMLYSVTKAYTQAELLYQRALAIYEKALGTDHPDIATFLNNFALLSWVQGDSKEALTGLQRSAGLAERNTASILILGDEARKRAYMQMIRGDVAGVVSFAMAIPSEASQSLAAELVIQRKGRVLDTLADSFSSLRKSLAPQDQALLTQWRETGAQYANLLFAGPGQRSPEQYRQALDELKARTDAQEAKLARRSARFRQQVRSVSLSQVQAALPSETALIEWYRYIPFNPTPKGEQESWGEPRYVAAVIPPKGVPVLVDLGDAGEIDALVAELLIPLRSPHSSRGAFADTARELDERLMQPLRPHLGKFGQLFLSPDGALNLLPFGVMIDAQGRYLAQTTPMTYLTSGRDLLQMAEASASRQPPVVLANPDYGPLAGKAAQVSASGRRSSEVRAGVLHFESLEGMREEAEALQEILPAGSDVLIGAKATEAAVKRLEGPRLLHLATHGFFLHDQPLDAPRMGLLSDDLRAPVPKGENPLLRAGLALAGANQLRSGEDDGLLTALEVSGLDLAGTQLAVLSACETGVGDVQSGEGVYGLRRAFTLAGVETQLASLWKVDDAGTRDLMIDYYKGLMAGKGRSQALHDAQLKMLNDPARAHPNYWAAFVVIGNPAPIGK